MNRYAAGDISRIEWGGALRNDGLADRFRSADVPNVSGSERVTWVDNAFARMGEQSRFDFNLRWDRLADVHPGHFDIATFRQADDQFANDCTGGPNGHQIALALQGGGGRWRWTIKGSRELPWPDAEYQSRSWDCGRIEVDKTVRWHVRVVWSSSAGSLVVQRDGSVVIDAQGVPIGFRLGCDGGAIASDRIRVQHGIYRHPRNKATWVLRSSGIADV